jgi:hypothetical protein
MILLRNRQPSIVHITHQPLYDSVRRRLAGDRPIMPGTVQ